METRKKVFQCKEILDEIRATNSPDATYECFKILRIFFKNILENKRDEAKRYLKRTNPVIASKVIPLKNIQQFFVLAGFSQPDSEHYYLDDLDMALANATYQYLNSYMEKYSSVPKEARKINESAKKETETKAQIMDKIEMQFKEDRKLKKDQDLYTKSAGTSKKTTQVHKKPSH
eukprot:TRINITY_DN4759_c0_g1_i4.p2 TRINITY_DN4759_c0_g1~~TRINITY_DN4759_c0_g1_i4.p2  ORF type:complete len:175 (-),score=59.00 TRINITY_DN4759_c0_g1_i4:68-592(-)